MDISLLTFHGFDQEGKTLLAKQVEVKPAEDGHSDTTSRRRRSRAELLAILEAELDESEVAGLFDEVRAMFEAHWPRATPWLLGSGL